MRALFAIAVLLATPTTMLMLAFPEGTWRDETRIGAVLYVLFVGVAVAADLLIPKDRK